MGNHLHSHHGHSGHHDHHHHHDHDHQHHHGPGHNHSHGDHLHSHAHGDTGRARQEELRVLGASFIEGFRNAADKNSYLRIAGIPFQVPGADGLALNLVDAAIHSNWQVATASPAFGSRELVYLPFPGEMIRDRETMRFTYVSLTSRRDVDLLEILAEKLQNGDG